MKQKDKPRLTTATNNRGIVFKHYKVNDEKMFAVQGGRCHKCGKITDAYCDLCSAWVCENHMSKSGEYECYCKNCEGKNDKNVSYTG